MCDKCKKIEVNYPDGRVFRYGKHWIHIVDDLSIGEVIELDKYLHEKIINDYFERKQKIIDESNDEQVY